ncbi:hypothetical protein [Streptomyces sp. AM 2-1-1]|uniref:ABC transporter substrate-binding protein n=1 Tax=Streptomyces sp. AM 2-1-1 TaxID=3028709 RepID=UPI0023B88664|nr:hypothetical protein [Streptomyces sp. AM 2-1-1]WEH41866.1 hypothetical protein PZB77_21545 [Streptomyces sp. AM 2-1-1]
MTRGAWQQNGGNEAASAVFHLVQELIDRYRINRPVMPIVVAQAEDPGAGPGIDERVREIAHLVHRANEPRRVPVRLLESRGTSPYESALGMVRTLAERPWETRERSQYKPFTFPRSRLLGAIEQATAQVVARPGGGAPADRGERILEELGSLRWRPTRSGPDDWTRSLRASVRPETFLGAVFIAVLGVLLGEIGWTATLLLTAAATLVLAVVRLLTTSAPPLLWLRRASRWLATTSSLAASSTAYPSDGWSWLSPSGSWRVIRARAAAVALRVAEAREGDAAARQFHLELRVQALLEDLRHNYRPRAWDGRRGKRTVPPVVLLPTATRENGGVLLINAINNVRSRRSEVDPLLLLASLPAAEELTHTPSQPPVDPSADRRVPWSGAQARYRRWVDDLSIGQSPAGASALSWVLRLPLSTAQLTHEHADARLHTVRVRRTWAWFVMSRTSVALILVGSLLGTFLWSEHWQATYCHGPLTDRNTDAVWSRSGPRECVGVATAPEVWFAGGNDLELRGLGTGVTFERVERAVREENAGIGADESYVTVVYAGPLTAEKVEDSRKGLEELTGVYLHQRSVNSPLTKHPVKLKVLLANGGEDMLHQTVTVRKIIEVARQDPHVVGVVGMGRNTTESEEATEALRKAGLAVVDTTNSSGELPRKSNYFGLAATDEEQTYALGLVARRLAPPDGTGRALVLSRTKENGDKDQYTIEQRDAGRKMLEAAGYLVGENVGYPLADNGAAALGEAVASLCEAPPVPDALYFAGRAEDVDPLMEKLSHTTGCSRKDITVFTGDDLTKATFTDTGRVTLYYTALAPTAADRGAAFYPRASAALAALLPEGTGRPTSRTGPEGYRNALWASGQIVMAYSATAALYDAAARGDVARSAAETWALLHTVDLDDMPTGTVSLAGSPASLTDNLHGLDVVKVVGRGAEAVTSIVCGKAAGRTPEKLRLTGESCRP